MDVLDVLAVEPSTPRAFERSSPRETRAASAQGSPAPLGPLELEVRAVEPCAPCAALARVEPSAPSVAVALAGPSEPCAAVASEPPVALPRARPRARSALPCFFVFVPVVLFAVLVVLPYPMGFSRAEIQVDQAQNNLCFLKVFQTSVIGPQKIGKE
eukprot:4171196-Alexandrium_andersonii.AAC.1